METKFDLFFAIKLQKIYYYEAKLVRFLNCKRIPQQGLSLFLLVFSFYSIVPTKL